MVEAGRPAIDDFGLAETVIARHKPGRTMVKV